MGKICLAVIGGTIISLGIIVLSLRNYHQSLTFEADPSREDREEPGETEQGGVTTTRLWWGNVTLTRGVQGGNVAEAGRILCLIPTDPARHQRLHPIKDTWGRRCDVMLFMSTQEDRTIPTIALPVWEGWRYLWAKMNASFRYVYERHLQDVDWVLKADDDTYVVMENLRHFLSNYNCSEPVYFGHRMRQGSVEWMDGGAGYVLSWEAVRRLVEEGECHQGDVIAEDVAVAECLESVGVRPVDTRDDMGRERFLPLKLLDHFSGSNVVYQVGHVRSGSKYVQGKGFDCCSEQTISIHRTQPRDMYLLEFLIYYINIYRVNPGTGATVRSESCSNSSHSDIHDDGTDNNNTTFPPKTLSTLIPL